jgi:hypothetical protein
MSGSDDSQSKGRGGRTSPDPARRLMLKKLVWAAPAVVATATVRARAAQGTGVGCGPPDGED